MSSFPPKNWVVRYLKDMDSLTNEPSKDGNIHMEAFMAARPAEGQEGAFRLIVSGSSHLDLLIPVDAILPHPAFAGMSIEAQLRLGTQVKIEPNSACSKWVDIVELIQSQDMDVVTEDSESVSEKFLTIMETLRKDKAEENTGKLSHNYFLEPLPSIEKHTVQIMEGI